MNWRQPRYFRFLVLLELLVGPGNIGLRAEEQQFTGEPMDSVMVPDGLSADEVRTTVALAQRGWTVTAKKDTHVVGDLNHRRNGVTLTPTVDSEQIMIYSDGWRLDRMGNHAKRDPAEGGVENIKKDLNKMLHVAAVAM